MTERQKLLAWCKKYCNNPDLIDADDFSYALDQLETSMASIGVTSESLSDMSQSFGVNESGMSIKNVLAPYKRLKML